MIPIRFQGCKMGIFGLESWDPPKLPHHPHSVLSPHVLSEQPSMPIGSKGLGRMPDTYTNSGWPMDVQNQTLVSIGADMLVQPNCLSGTDLDADAVGMMRCGRGSGARPSSGAWPVGSVGSALTSNEIGSLIPTRDNSVNGFMVNTTEMIARQNSGLPNGNQLRFENVNQPSNGHGVFSHSLRATFMHRTNPAVSNPIRMTQEPSIQKSQGMGEQNIQTSDDVKARWFNNTSSEHVRKLDPLLAGRVGCRLIAKHNYEANPNSPLGAGKELNLRRMDQLVRIGCHPDHDKWWLARNERGEEGYIPSTYVMVIEENGGFPWMHNCPPEEGPAMMKQVPNPFQPAYDKNSTNRPFWNQYACEPYGNNACSQPYNTHMNSHSHREALETTNGSNVFW